MLIFPPKKMKSEEKRCWEIEMYYAVKTLLDKGKNLSEISRELNIDRKTVRKIGNILKDGKVSTPEFSRKSVLEPYKAQIIEYLSEGLSRDAVK